ncbi:MAG: hypothetical protein O9302_01580 [Cyclobacteriaceae bacterium]|jgi:hypothetical protein|nr:hypothetical protein [Flammeovirgaceae bacterium]MCZ8023080.1 hypothetical protein [Cytophagales bacterium]MCZ8326722.1 hypothetical protein [Cyclobacteriaceae bacterium]
MNKNPLNDLDQFLQQQASSFVSPASLSDKLNEPKTVNDKEEENLSDRLLQLAKENPEAFYKLLIQVGEKHLSQPNSLLINTAIILANPTNWKEEIEKYWKGKL